MEGKNRKNMRDRVIRDEIHRDVLVPAHHARIIDTHEFQRLRNIQQLSTCEFVFPSATPRALHIPLVHTSSQVS